MQFVLLYTVGWDRIGEAAEDINSAVEDGALGIGERHGLPVLRFPLAETSDAHRASESAAIGKVLITIAPTEEAEGSHDLRPVPPQADALDSS